MTNPMRTTSGRALLTRIALCALALPFALQTIPAATASSGSFAGSLALIQPGERLVTASLLTETSEVAPGSTLTIGVQLEMAPGWHIYWMGQNDSGTAPTIEWTLPAGWKAGPISWPAPERYSPTDGLLDYVYHGRAVLLVPLSIPAEAKVGETARLAARVSWLVCKDSCVPGRADLSAQVRVAERSAEPSPRTAERFKAARAALPKPVPTGAQWLSQSWSGSTLTVKVVGATGLAFMPHESGALLRDALEHGAANADTLTLPFRPLSDNADPSDPRRVLGVLEVKRRSKEGTTSTEYWVMDLPLPGAAPEANPASR